MERNKNLISISGKIGSGKSTVGKIIQYLTFCSKNPNYTVPYSNNIWQLNKSDYETKMFANTLKDIVCLLIGCTKEQLEDAEFKNKELGEEWWVWLETSSYGGEPKLYSYSQYPTAPSFPHCSLIKLTPRMLLQEIGTQLFREQLHPQIWVNSLFSNYDKQIVGYAPGYYSCKCGKCNKEFTGDKRAVRCEECSIFYPSWIITDCRFKNELEAVKQRGGITIRVERELNTCVCVDESSKLDCLVKCKNKITNHISETDLDNQKFDYLINNDGSISDLIDKVKAILIKEEII